ncbi:hypothetical protein BU25DRAFT_472984 [Macroventuria anomochaeta]|uniref:Uncharacterized protein n=1 Tax=Macroventuria anomochaeta TaxID=301207 RepID=A0ACB6RX02_9PLEO|nr:uncharacterized protein BU25DRAFT_472984 [Macroventuria anomochaeta]KAF2625679.1 hypothetical protein BU25DRAFT_472984 [Macroventuria anomochaeta]
MFLHDIEVADKSTLPYDAHSIQRLLDRLPIFSGDLSSHVRETRQQSQTPLRPPPCLDIRGRSYDRARTVPLLGHRYWACWPQYLFFVGAKATMDDITMIATSIFIGMYLNELLYISSDIHPVSVFHHLRAVIVALVMVTRNVRWEVEANTTAYTVLIMTYDRFPLRRQSRSHANARSRYLRHPSRFCRSNYLAGKHRMNMWFCYAAMILTILGTISETIVTISFYKLNFLEWSFSVQVATLILRVVFMVAQEMSLRMMRKLAEKHRNHLKQLQAIEKDIELSSSVEMGGAPSSRSASQGSSTL